MLPYNGRVVSNFVVQAFRDGDISIYGEGSQTRSFCYVDAMVNAIIRIMNTPWGFTGPVDAGKSDEVSILGLAKKLIQPTDSSSKIIYGDIPGDEPRRKKPDISLAERELGWNPETDLETGLIKTIWHFRGCLIEYQPAAVSKFRSDY